MSPRHQIFADARLRGATQTDAALEAGYAESNARKTGSVLGTNADIVAYIAERQLEAAERATLSVESVLRGIAEVTDRCMQAVPVRAREGAETGEWEFQPGPALKGWELLGKHLGMWPNKVSVYDYREQAQRAADALGIDVEEVLKEAKRLTEGK